MKFHENHSRKTIIMVWHMLWNWWISLNWWLQIPRVVIIILAIPGIRMHMFFWAASSNRVRTYTIRVRTYTIHQAPIYPLQNQHSLAVVWKRHDVNHLNTTGLLTRHVDFCSEKWIESATSSYGYMDQRFPISKYKIKSSINRLQFCEPGPM